MLKIYTDTHFLNETHRKNIFPILLDLWFLKSEKLKHHFSITESVNSCNIIIMPIHYEAFLKYKKEFDVLLKLAKDNNKPLWFYTAGDFGFTHYIPNSYNFRLGGFKSKLDNSNIIIPSFISDPYLRFDLKFKTLNKQVKPTIGFVGHAHSGFFKFCKEYINHLKTNLKITFEKKKADKQKFYPSSIKRAKYLNILKEDERLNTNFILRKSYRAGSLNKKAVEETTQEFFKNIYNNSYTFCSRGVGNFSVRLYETLAMGRIPILLNTDCKLPLDNLIDWNEHCIIIEESEIKKIGIIVLDFHNSFSNDEFLDIQERNRMLWKNMLSRDSFYINIKKEFLDRIEKKKIK